LCIAASTVPTILTTAQLLHPCVTLTHTETKLSHPQGYGPHESYDGTRHYSWYKSGRCTLKNQLWS